MPTSLGSNVCDMSTSPAQEVPLSSQEMKLTSRLLKRKLAEDPSSSVVQIKTGGQVHLKINQMLVILQSHIVYMYNVIIIYNNTLHTTDTLAFNFHAGNQTSKGIFPSIQEDHPYQNPGTQ